MKKPAAARITITIPARMYNTGMAIPGSETGAGTGVGVGDVYWTGVLVFVIVEMMVVAAIGIVVVFTIPAAVTFFRTETAKLEKPGVVARK
jgi:hypothetical protein